MHRCPACGGELAVWRSVRSSEPALAAQLFALRRCVRCGTAVTVGSAPSELHDSGAYSPGSPRGYVIARPVLECFDRQRLGLVRALMPPPATLLDAGAGRGRFVRSAAGAGYDARGIEPSARGVAAAASSGTPVARDSIETASIEPASLDVVSLWHVLEHLDEPGPALGRIHGWLRPGGVLLAGTPNLASVQARLSGARWYHLDVPRHRTHFTAAGLRAILESHGFSIVRVQHTLLEQNPFGMWQSLVSLATRHPSYLYNLLKRNAPLASSDLAVTIAAVPLLPIAGLLELVAGMARRGGTIAILARR